LLCQVSQGRVFLSLMLRRQQWLCQDYHQPRTYPDARGARLVVEAARAERCLLLVLILVLVLVRSATIGHHFVADSGSVICSSQAFKQPQTLLNKSRLWIDHRDKTRVRTPVKMFPHLKLFCWLFMGPTLGFDT
jgi:hypothetical protein